MESRRPPCATRVQRRTWIAHQGMLERWPVHAFPRGADWSGQLWMAIDGCACACYTARASVSACSPLLVRTPSASYAWCAM